LNIDDNLNIKLLENTIEISSESDSDSVATQMIDKLDIRKPNNVERTKNFNKLLKPDDLKQNIYIPTNMVDQEDFSYSLFKQNNK